MLNFADSYVIASTQSFDALAATSARPEVIHWAKQQRIATAMAAYTNATGPNPLVAATDLIILTSLKRTAFERHWIPTLLHDEGAEVLAVAKRLEADAWQMAGKALTPSQVTDLRQVVEAWIEEHPDQYYVGWVRLGDIAAQQGRAGSTFKLPANLLGLFAIDPLAGLDPVTQELRSYRALTERLVFMFMRMPMVLSWQVEETVQNATSTPETRAFTAATSRFADATSRFADTTGEFPELIRTERQNAIKQVGEELTAQRTAVLNSLADQEQRINGILGETRRTLSTAEASATKINASVAQTVQSTEKSSARLVSQIRNAVIITLVIVIVGVVIVILAYRLIPNRRR